MRVVVWANSLGAELYVKTFGAARLAGLVAASNRPDDRAAVESIAARAGCPLLVQPRATDDTDQFDAALRRLEADLFLVNIYSMIIPSRWFTLPPLGSINVHTGLLPQYRGANVLNWVLINGETETGVTAHVIDAGLDTGPVVEQRRVPIAFHDTALTLRNTLLEVIGPLLADTLDRAEREALDPVPQDESRARVWPRRTADDGEIDWDAPAETVYNLIRALVRPWPGAFYYNADGARVVLDSFMPLAQVTAMQERILASRGRRHSPA